MAKKRKVRGVGAMLESSYGVYVAPALGTDVILTKNLVLDDPYAGDRVSRDLDLPALGLQSEINVNPYVKCSFEVEVAGSGTAGVAPRYGRLLKACGFTETVDDSTGVPEFVDYDPNSVLDDSVSLTVYLDGQLHKMPGSRGSVSFTWQKGIPTMKFTFWGLYVRPLAGTLPTADFDDIPIPLPVTEANTTLSVGSYSGPALSLACDMAMTLVARNVIGQEEILLSDRAPTGPIVIDMPDIGDINLYSVFVESHAGINTGALDLVHGTAAGNIVEFTAPKVQLSTLNEGEDSGIETHTLNARYLPDVGDDDVKLTVR